MSPLVTFVQVTLAQIYACLGNKKIKTRFSCLDFYPIKKGTNKKEKKIVVKGNAASRQSMCCRGSVNTWQHLGLELVNQYERENKHATLSRSAADQGGLFRR